MQSVKYNLLYVIRWIKIRHLRQFGMLHLLQYFVKYAKIRRVGNRPTAFLSPEGYKNLGTKFHLKASNRMCSENALGIFLWTLGRPQSVTQVHDRFKRSRATINRKFVEVLYCVNHLAGNIIKPIDP
jgi:hypothetical protein